MDIELKSANLAPLDIDAPAEPSAPVEIGGRVRALRKERGWTLEQTSQQAGISLSALSKIERGELSPTLTSINKIAKGFGIDVVTLLANPQEDRGRGRRSISRRGEGVPVTTGTCRNLWLAADLAHKKMLPFRTRVVARKPTEYSEWARHSGETFVYVLSGRLVVYSELYQPLVLEAGESMYYDASTGHKWCSEGPEDAEVMWVYAG